MKRVRTHRFPLTAATFLSGWILGGALPPGAGLLWASDRPPIAPVHAASPNTAPSGIAFLTKKTRLWLGRSQVLCFSAKQTVEESRYLSFKVDEKYLHVLIPPTLLPGATIGYLRLRPLTEGTTQINLEGASIEVEIVKDTAASTLEQTRPAIIAPANGAVVWGSFVVGVEQLNLSTNPHPLQPVLRLPDGHEIAAHEVPDGQPGPHLRYVFTVDAKSLHPGTNELVAVCKVEPGHDVVSEPLDVVVISPDPAAVLSGDCKDQIDTQFPPLPVKIPFAPPDRPKFTPPVVITDDKAGLGPVVSDPSDNPPWCMPVMVPGKGRYEMLVTTRGDIGGNALPTLALTVDNNQNPLTTVRLATTEWQRLPVGHPVTLEDGKHIVAVRFRNTFNQGPTDSRHLYLARYELVRLDPPASPAPAPAPVLADNQAGTVTMQPGAPDETTMPSKEAAAPATPPAMQNVAAASPAPSMQTAMQASASMMQPLPVFGGFHVVFKDALEGQTIAGPVQINARCWWPNSDHSPPPAVDLLVNGKVVASMTTPQPQFKIDLAAFQPGKNQIQLRGLLANGQYASSPVENIFLPKDLNPGKEPSGPMAAISYPPNGATVGLADAVVANVSAPEGIASADLLIDGQPQHLNLSPPDGLGPLLFPLLTRNLTPGTHRLQVTVKGLAGSAGSTGLTGASSEVSVTVSGQDQVTPGNYARALFLLNRFGYGPEPRELAAILTMGSHAWLEARLNETIDSPLEENEQERLHAEFPDENSAVPRAVQYLLTDANPVRARFLMWTENHFSTWQNKDGAGEKSREHDRFLELGVAPFPDLLLASATSPAMLIYLDQRNSVARRLNENYAREIMELHTLGAKGGYTQQDVTTLADLLTGWTLADEAPVDGSGNLEHTFRYNPYLNSGNPCQILGMNFPGVPLDRRFDRVLTALNMLAAHPSCAQFISRKLIEHYVSDPAPPGLVNDLAQIYMETGGDLRVMLLDLSDKPEFWAAAPKVASPVDFGVRLARLANMANPGAVNDIASHSGMGMFDRATPDGYPEDDGYYASSNGLLQRWHFAQNVQTSFLDHGLIPNDWKPTDHQWDPATTQRLVDLAAVRITGDVLSDASNAAVLQLIASAAENTEGRLHLLATFLCQVPETSLR